MIRQARTITGIGLNVMIRPRGGDFLFDDDEFAIMRSDIETAKAEGAMAWSSASSARPAKSTWRERAG